MYACVLVCVCVCRYIHTRTKTHTHTHKHTNTQTHIQGHSEIGQMKQAMFWAGLYGGISFSTLVLLLFLAAVFPANSSKGTPIKGVTFPANRSMGTPLSDGTTFGVEGTPFPAYLSPGNSWRQSPVGGAIFVFRGVNMSVRICCVCMRAHMQRI